MRCQLASGANWDVTDRYDCAQPCNDLFTVLSVCQCFLPTLCRSPSMRWQWKTCLRVTTCTPAPSVSAKYEQRNGKTSPTVWTATSGGLWKSDEPISLKLGVMIGPASRKKLFTFGGAPIPDTDSGSIFHFTHHCGIGNFRRFISISHTVGAWFLRDLAKWMVMNPQYFGRDPADIRTRSGLESCIAFGWNFGIVLRFGLCEQVSLHLHMFAFCHSLSAEHVHNAPSVNKDAPHLPWLAWNGQPSSCE